MNHAFEITSISILALIWIIFFVCQKKEKNAKSVPALKRWNRLTMAANFALIVAGAVASLALLLGASTDVNASSETVENLYGLTVIDDRGSSFTAIDATGDIVECSFTEDHKLIVCNGSVVYRQR